VDEGFLAYIERQNRKCGQEKVTPNANSSYLNSLLPDMDAMLPYQMRRFQTLVDAAIEVFDMKPPRRLIQQYTLVLLSTVVWWITTFYYYYLSFGQF
jgi:hypothetical protein